MNLDYDRPPREKAWIAVRLAVRAYARDPCDNNAARVQRAWDTIRQMEVRTIQSSRAAVQSCGPFRPLRMHHA